MFVCACVCIRPYLCERALAHVCDTQVHVSEYAQAATLMVINERGNP